MESGDECEDVIVGDGEVAEPGDGDFRGGGTTPASPAMAGPIS